MCTYTTHTHATHTLHSHTHTHHIHTHTTHITAYCIQTHHSHTPHTHQIHPTFTQHTPHHTPYSLHSHNTHPTTHPTPRVHSHTNILLTHIHHTHMRISLTYTFTHTHTHKVDYLRADPTVLTWLKDAQFCKRLKAIELHTLNGSIVWHVNKYVSVKKCDAVTEFLSPPTFIVPLLTSSFKELLLRHCLIFSALISCIMQSMREGVQTLPYWKSGHGECRLPMSSIE